MDALALRGDEGRDRLRKAAGRCQYSLIRGYPNGETRWSSVQYPISSIQKNREVEAFCFNLKEILSIEHWALNTASAWQSEYIGLLGEPGELKHLSTQRKGHQTRLR